MTKENERLRFFSICLKVAEPSSGGVFLFFLHGLMLLTLNSFSDVFLGECKEAA
jgi:hypothetical protein